MNDMYKSQEIQDFTCYLYPLLAAAINCSLSPGYNWDRAEDEARQHDWLDFSIALFGLAHSLLLVGIYIFKAKLKTTNQSDRQPHAEHNAAMLITIWSCQHCRLRALRVIRSNVECVIAGLFCGNVGCRISLMVMCTGHGCPNTRPQVYIYSC